MKLYETYAQLEALWLEIEDVLCGNAEGDQTEDGVLDALEAALAEIEDARDEKAVRIACLVKNLRADAEAIKAEKQRLQKRQMAAEKTADRLSRYLEQFLPPGTKLKDARAVIGWRKSEAVVCGVDPKQLPEEFQRVKIEANASAMKKALKEGETIPGVELEERNNIQIR